MHHDDPKDWRKLLPGLELELITPVRPAGEALDEDELAPILVHAGLAAEIERAGYAQEPVTLVVNDAHRPTDTAAFVGAFFDVLRRHVPKADRLRLRLLVAAGTHRADFDEQQRHEARIAGSLLRRFDEVRWHDCDDPQMLASVGDFAFQRWLAEPGLFVACGSTEPHYFAGVTGAHKTLTVGVMSRESIEANHAGAMSPQARAMALEGNPVHEGIVRALDALERGGARLFALNQLVVGGSALAAWAGPPLQSLADALPAVRSCFVRTVDKPADVIVAEVHPPLDRDLYQADKGIKNVEVAVRDGGFLIVEAACKHGVGIDHFLNLLKEARSYADAFDVVQRRGYRLGDHKAVRLRALTDTRAVHVALISPGIDSMLSDALGMAIFPDHEGAARWLRERLDVASARGLLVEDAANVALELA